MKRTVLIVCLAWVLASLSGVTAPRVYAQQSLTPSQAAARSVAKDEHMDAPEGENQIEQYRHSSVVQGIAKTLHVSTETAAEIFEDINSGVLLGTFLIVLLKILPRLFRNRSEKLQQDLAGARVAIMEADQRLADVKARLQRLDTEIDAIRHQVEQEAAQDEKRIHAAMESEKERIVASAEQEIAAVQAAAQRDLKKFAADLAIDHAMRKLQLSTDTDRALIREFGKNLNSGSRGKA